MFGDRSIDFDRHSNPFERHARLFKKGDLKYVILDLLKDKPSHGYEITLALEDRFHGLYSPSAGSVYPILQLLEDMGYVTAIEKDGKKVYTITDLGTAFLKEQQATTDKIKGRLRGWWGSGNREYLKDLRAVLVYTHDLQHLVREVAVRRDPARLIRVKEILAKTYNDVRAVAEER